ncbi:MAG: NAD(P)H-dependent oxidoreductase subunit E [Euryarchaeota archaeon]|nr:NAD(P)H-dependent oxidoreductase subunit E [Euryarchaeota archaeon]
MDAKDRKMLDDILSSHRDTRDPAMLILQKVQTSFGYTGQDHLTYISEKSCIPLSKLYGIVTFYPSFRLSPPGKSIIRICEGTSCHVRGGARIVKELERQLGIGPGQTTKDRKFSLESVRCLGCCGISPVVMMDDKTYGRVKATKLAEILATHGGE